MSEELENQPIGGLVEVAGRLRAAREHAKLTIAEVATQLRLRPQLLEALELHRVEDLPPPTYVAGYIRAYARLLELPAEELVSRYEETAGVPSTVIVTPQEIETRAPVKLIVIAITVGVIVLAVLWWVGRESKAPAAPTVATTQAPAAPEATPIDPGQAVPLNLPPAAPAAAPAEIPAPLPAQVPGPAAEVKPEAPKPVGPPPLTDSTPQASLALHFTADCWTEVSDSAGRQLVYELFHAGDDRVVQGQAPFKVFLGYAQGVVVQYNGQSFDTTPFVRDNVARFRVGRPTDNRPVNE